MGTQSRQFLLPSTDLHEKQGQQEQRSPEKNLDNELDQDKKHLFPPVKNKQTVPHSPVTPQSLCPQHRISKSFWLVIGYQLPRRVSPGLFLTQKTWGGGWVLPGSPPPPREGGFQPGLVRVWFSVESAENFWECPNRWGPRHCILWCNLSK